MDLIKWFDASIVMFINQLSQRWYFFDRVVCGLEGEPLVKGGVLTAFLWWAWFRKSSDKLRDRGILLSGVLSSICALAVARIAAFCLPFRERPVFTSALHFRAPFGTSASSLINWSSFPSDHAALYFALATVIFFVSRRAGLFAYIYTAIFIALPRLYVGDHYPTDLLCGAAIGIMIANLFASNRASEMVVRFALSKVETVPARVYVVLYLGSFLLANNFDPVRKVGSLLFHSLRTHGGM